MNSFVNALASIIQHIFKNISNYGLLVGLLLVVNFIFKKYGSDVGLLSIGVLLILSSFVLEINNINNKGRKKY